MRYVAIFVKHSILDVWRCSEYASSSKYARVLNKRSRNIKMFRYAKVLNTPFLKYKQVPCKGCEYYFCEIWEGSVMPGFWIYLSQNITKVTFPENEKTSYKLISITSYKLISSFSWFCAKTEETFVLGVSRNFYHSFSPISRFYWNFIIF